MLGYDRLPASPPLAPTTAKLRAEEQRSPFAVRRSLAGLGYQETINFSFVEERWEHELAGNPNPIKLLNPIASHLSAMRSSLLGSLVQVLKFNLDRKAARVRVFELGRVFLRDASVKDTDTTVAGFHQPMQVSGLAYGALDTLQWGFPEQQVGFFDVKGDIEALLAPAKPAFEPADHPSFHPGRSAKVSLDGVAIGYVGELHPKWRQAYDLPGAPILFELSLDAVLRRALPQVRPIARFQAVQRDIAVLVAEHVSHAALVRSIRAAPTGGVLRDAELFDVYRPKPGKPGADALTGNSHKSLAVRLTLNSFDATLTEEQIEAAIQSILDQLGKDLDARQRS